MDKDKAIEILKSKGYIAYDSSGILYIEIDNLDKASISKIRELFKDIHYNNSWGVKMLSSAASSVHKKDDSNKSLSSYDTESTEDCAKRDNIYIDDTKSVIEERVSTVEGNNEYYDDDMDFDENSSFEQVSLFDMMS